MDRPKVIVAPPLIPLTSAPSSEAHWSCRFHLLIPGSALYGFRSLWSYART
jgi:hypothetical protein